jgi:hypothetical protein
MSTPLLGLPSLEPPSVLEALLPELQPKPTQSRHPHRLRGFDTRPIMNEKEAPFEIVPAATIP